MKRLFKSMMIAAIAAVSFISCQKDPVAQTENTITMRLHASSSTVDTRTSVSENQNGGYDINWSADDQVQVIEFVDNEFSQSKASKELESEAQTATFEVELGEKTGTSFLYETVYPADAYSKSTSGETFYRLNISDDQTYSKSSFDGAADVLISRPVHESEQPEELGLEYKRIGSAARMVLKGITANETITKVTFSTDEGYIAGYSRFDPTTAEFNGTYAGGSKKSIELTPASATVATGADVVWFRLYAITLTEGFKVVVTTDAATYTKEVNLATANRELAFNDGGLTKFNVAFAAENRHENVTASYIKVTEEPTDWTGEYILVYEDNAAAYCWTGIDAVNCFVPTSISNNEITSIPAGAATLSIAAMANGYSIRIIGGDRDGKFIGIESYANGLAYKETAILNTLTIGDGSAAITSSCKDGSCTMRFNSNSDQMRFRYYKSGQKAVQLYKLNDGKQNQNLSFDQSSIKAYTNDASFNKPTLSGAQTTVTYSSSNTSVATVDSSTGDITIVGTGTTTISADAIANDSYRAASASYTITVIAAYESLADLVAAGEPTGETVKVTITDAVISRIYTSGIYRNGIYTNVGDKEIEIYRNNVPNEWEIGGKINATIECPWKVYTSGSNSTWELCPTSWDDFGYTPVPKTLSSLSWTGYKTSYAVNSEFSINGTIKAIYNNGSEKVLSTDDCTLTGSPDLSAAGTTFATISYTEGGVTKTATATITVTDGSSSTTGILRITRSCFPTGSLAYNTTDAWSAVTSTDETVTGEGDLYSSKDQTTMQSKHSGVSTMYHNTVAVPGNITKITLKCASGTTRTYTVYMNKSTAITSTSGGTEKGTIAPTAGNTASLSLDAADGWHYFWLNLAGGASFLDYIEIEYAK